MARSNHHGCGGTCGVCRPHKKWKSNSVEDQKPAVQRQLQPGDGDVERAELAASDVGCTEACCAPPPEEPEQ